ARQSCGTPSRGAADHVVARAATEQCAAEWSALHQDHRSSSRCSRDVPRTYCRVLVLARQCAAAARRRYSYLDIERRSKFRSLGLAGPWEPKLNALVAFGIAIALFFGILHFVRSRPLPGARSAAIALAALGAIGVALAIWVDADAVPHSWRIGAVGLLLLGIS